MPISLSRFCPHNRRIGESVGYRRSLFSLASMTASSLLFWLIIPKISFPQNWVSELKLRNYYCMAKEDILGSNQIEDVSWLCCLTESELDFLISLKMMVLQRAKLVNHESLANKFDLKILQALGFILMEHFKGKIKDLSDIPGLAGVCASLDGSNLLKQNLDGNSGIMSIEELRAFIGTHQRKRAAELYSEEVFKDLKRRAGGG